MIEINKDFRIEAKEEIDKWLKPVIEKYTGGEQRYVIVQLFNEEEFADGKYPDKIVKLAVRLIRSNQDMIDAFFKAREAHSPKQMQEFKKNLYEAIISLVSDILFKEYHACYVDSHEFVKHGIRVVLPLNNANKARFCFYQLH